MCFTELSCHVSNGSGGKPLLEKERARASASFTCCVCSDQYRYMLFVRTEKKKCVKTHVR